MSSETGMRGTKIGQQEKRNSRVNNEMRYRYEKGTFEKGTNDCDDDLLPCIGL